MISSSLYAIWPVNVAFTKNAKLTKLDSFDGKKRWFASDNGETSNELARMGDVQYVLNEIDQFVKARLHRRFLLRF